MINLANKPEEINYNKNNLKSENSKIISNKNNIHITENINDDFLGLNKNIKNVSSISNTKRKTSYKNNLTENENNFQELDYNSKNNNFKSQILTKNNQNSLNYDKKDSEKPLLIIDVKLGEGLIKNIKVFEGDSADKLSNDFSLANGIKNYK